MVDAETGSLTWDVSVAPHTTHRLTISVSAVRPHDGRFRPLVPAAGAPAWAVDVTTDDPRVDRFVRWGRDDLEHLLLADPEAPSDAFAAAGSPWFFTLFGRDSLWTARMMLPFGTAVAMSTLRVLARRQGVHHDPTTDEQPGRILHELRTAPVDTVAAQLPPLYYGTIDATQLWMLLLAESWRWGAPAEQVEALLPALERAATWLLADADADGDGLCEYRGGSGHGLSNQGWKDSGDSVGWQHGPPAEGPIALCEVQAYTYEAALGAADLLERFGRGGAAELRAFATRLREAFHAAFWVDDDDRRYLAIGLDGDKRAITGRSSNPGHAHRHRPARRR